MRLSFLTGLCLLALAAGACAAGPAATSRPQDDASRTRPAAAELGPGQRERLQRLAVPLLKAMNNPTPLEKVRVGVIDDPGINAANAGNGQFYVTRGLLEKASDDQLLGVLAHEVAHEDLGHVAKVQLLGAGLSAGIAILDSIFPGSGAITPVAGELVVRGYTRREEYAADRHGVELLKRVGRSKDVMIQSLDWLVATSGPSGGGILATHPSTEDRIKELRAM